MNSSYNRFSRIVDLIKKDTSINNSIDAVEQMCLLLLIKKVHELDYLTHRKISDSLSFEKFFNYVGSEVNSHTIRQLFNDGVNNWHFNHRLLGPENNQIIKELLESIPLRVRSEKILELVVRIIKDLDFYDKLESGFDEILFTMVKESKAAGAFYSPKPLVDALAAVTKPLPNERIYDPAMGTGRSFVGIRQYLLSNHDCDEVNATGKDISPFACLVGVLNLLFNDIDIKNISLSDSLLDNDDTKYDLILSAIPFGVVNETSKYEYAYKGYSGNLEAMFLKHSMDKLELSGRAAIVVPDGVLFNSSHSLNALREKLLTRFNLHTILSLPKNTLSPYSSVKVSVLFFDNAPPGRDIWFYDLASKNSHNSKNTLEGADFEEFISFFESRKVTKYSSCVDKNSLLENSTFNLSISLPTFEVKDNFEKKEAIDSLLASQGSFKKLMESYLEAASKEIHVVNERIVTIQSIGKLRTGLNLNKSELSKEAEYPVYGGNGVIGYYNNANRRECSIIIGKVGMYCGNVHFSEGPYWLTSNAISLELNDSSVYAPYLTYVLKSLDLNKLSTGAVQQFISIKQLNEIEIPLPSYDKQVELCNWFTTLEYNNNSIQRAINDFTGNLDVLTKNLISEKALDN